MGIHDEEEGSPVLPTFDIPFSIVPQLVTYIDWLFEKDLDMEGMPTSKNLTFMSVRALQASISSLYAQINKRESPNPFSQLCKYLFLCLFHILVSFTRIGFLPLSLLNPPPSSDLKC